jgi:hypothetical protein
MAFFKYSFQNTAFQIGIYGRHVGSSFVAHTAALTKKRWKELLAEFAAEGEKERGARAQLRAARQARLKNAREQAKGAAGPEPATLNAPPQAYLEALMRNITSAHAMHSELARAALSETAAGAAMQQRMQDHEEGEDAAALLLMH